MTEETEDGVAVIRLSSDNPLNPLTDELVDALVASLKRADTDPGVRAVVLTGSAKAFAAGANVKAMAPLGYADAFRQDYIGRNWDAIRQVRKPLVAAVQGYALGGGCELAMMCDIVLAAESAVFGQPEVALGIVPGAGGTQRLPRAVGKSLAMWMCLTGESITAAEAHQAGLVTRVVPDDEIALAAQQTAQAIARHSLPVVMAIKEAVNRAFESSLNEGLLFERRLFHAGFALHDQKEGIAAFTERRSASFTDQ
ncbi:enoyl-CoA hydratase-related protein [Streptomyces tendae]|uniref:enoyl-CoA hydratase-related protein n=1 Tax=Streptomyces tendae TaxID=1932 RepID=UPI0036BE02DB